MWVGEIDAIEESDKTEKRYWGFGFFPKEQRDVDLPVKMSCGDRDKPKGAYL